MILSHWKKVLFATFVTFSAPLFTQDERSFWDYHPIRLGGNFLQVGSASVEQERERSGSLSFQKSNLYLSAFLPIDEKSFFLPKVEWNHLHIPWDQNPKFQQSHFSYMQFSLAFFTYSLEFWRWIARVDYNLDVQHFSRPRLYGLFSGIIWGAYELNDQWHQHVGILGYTGMKGQMVYPVIGFDYTPSPSWLFEVIFPIVYSIQYKINESWRIAVQGRPLKERVRTSYQETQPRSILNYSSMGAEANLKYEIPFRVQLEVYGGYNFGGTAYIKDERGRSSLYMSLKAAPYAGAALEWGF